MCWGEKGIGNSRVCIYEEKGLYKEGRCWLVGEVGDGKVGSGEVGGVFGEKGREESGI